MFSFCRHHITGISVSRFLVRSISFFTRLQYICASYVYRRTVLYYIVVVIHSMLSFCIFLHKFWFLRFYEITYSIGIDSEHTLDIHFSRYFWIWNIEICALLLNLILVASEWLPLIKYFLTSEIWSGSQIIMHNILISLVIIASRLDLDFETDDINDMSRIV